MTVQRDALIGKWVHSHEDDTDAETVYRPSTFAFPPSRGRRALDLRGDGSLAESAIGPTDAPVESAGTWELRDGDTLGLHRPGRADTSLKVVSTAEDRLVFGR